MDADHRQIEPRGILERELEESREDTCLEDVDRRVYVQPSGCAGPLQRRCCSAAFAVMSDNRKFSQSWEMELVTFDRTGLEMAGPRNQDEQERAREITQQLSAPSLHGTFVVYPHSSLVRFSATRHPFG